MVLFMQPSPNTLGQVFRPVGMALGALPVRKLGGQNVAVRDLSDVSLISKQAKPLHGEDFSFAVAIQELKPLCRHSLRQRFPRHRTHQS